jgi:hypothetical protein
MGLEKLSKATSISGNTLLKHTVSATSDEAGLATRLATNHHQPTSNKTETEAGKWVETCRSRLGKVLVYLVWRCRQPRGCNPHLGPQLSAPAVDTELVHPTGQQRWILDRRHVFYRLTCTLQQLDQLWAGSLCFGPSCTCFAGHPQCPFCCGVSACCVPVQRWLISRARLPW